MRNSIIAIVIALTADFALAHEGIELGPNKGRIVEFSTDETMHGEVTLKDNSLHIALLDKDMKPVKVAVQSLSATAGTRQDPVKLTVTATEGGFSLPAPGDGEWLILQYKEAPDSKAITARLHYEIKTCAPCGRPEWRCACAGKE